jgi:predicted metal-dependent enzyme (double-stranded beta helix superfamily)
MFEVDEFVAQCRAALSEHTPQLAIKELLERAVSRPEEIAAALGPAMKAEIGTLYRGLDLTMLKVIWAPGMSIYPHDHRMWAVIGLYGGQEDNSFFRRRADGLDRVGGKELETRDAVLLGADVIHAVVNPQRIPAQAIHIYGGDFFAAKRSNWDSLTLDEHRSDGERTRRMFEEANAQYQAARALRAN